MVVVANSGIIIQQLSSLDLCMQISGAVFQCYAIISLRFLLLAGKSIVVAKSGMNPGFDKIVLSTCQKLLEN